MHDTLGALPAFLRVWSHLVAVFTASFAVIAITGATYLVQPIFGACGTPTIVVQLLAAVLLGKMAQYTSFTRWAFRTGQNTVA